MTKSWLSFGMLKTRERFNVAVDRRTKIRWRGDEKMKKSQTRGHKNAIILLSFLQLYSGVVSKTRCEDVFSSWSGKDLFFDKSEPSQMEMVAVSLALKFGSLLIAFVVTSSFFQKFPNSRGWAFLAPTTKVLAIDLLLRSHSRTPGLQMWYFTTTTIQKIRNKEWSVETFQMPGNIPNHLWNLLTITSNRQTFSFLSKKIKHRWWDAVQCFVFPIHAEPIIFVFFPFFFFFL